MTLSADAVSWKRLGCIEAYQYQLRHIINNIEPLAKTNQHNNDSNEFLFLDFGGAG
jgi:hypothetical protein